MSEIAYEIESTEIKGFTYQTPLIYVDEHGDLALSHSKDKDSHVHIKKLIFLKYGGP